MRRYRRLLAALAAPCLFAGPALADTTPYTLTSASGWTKIASSGSSVLVAASGGPVTLSTTSTGSPPAAPAGFGLLPTQSVCWSVTADLYAQAPQAALFGQSTVTVTTGIACSGGGSGGGSTSPPPTVMTVTSTEVAVPAAASTLLLAANASRKFGSWTNDGVNPCRVSYGAAASAANGEPLAAAPAALGQGGARSFDAGVVTQQAIYAYCTTASSFAVLEGQ